MASTSTRAFSQDTHLSTAAAPDGTLSTKTDRRIKNGGSGYQQIVCGATRVGTCFTHWERGYTPLQTPGSSTCFAYQYKRSSLFIRTANNKYATFRHNGGNKYRPSTSSRSRTHSQLPNRARPSEVEMYLSGSWSLHGEPSTAVLRVLSILPSATAAFDLFIATLEPWETKLLQHVNLLVDPFSLCLELTPGFRAVSDGSVTTQLHGSIGWIVSSLSGNRLATGMGPARGRSPLSFRAEAYGLLSFLRFLLRIKEYRGMHNPWVGILATDGQSVLETLQLGNHDPQEKNTSRPRQRRCGLGLPASARTGIS